VFLERITTRNFRNLEPSDYSFHPSVNLLVGMNGQGKTNLLEAIYFLATTKSFRTPRIASLYRFGTTNLFAGGSLQRGALQQSLSVGIDSLTPQRALLFNGQPASLSDYLSTMHVFAYSAARLEIIRGGPEERRRFLDRGVASIQPGYIDHLSRYQRILKQRNALLHSVASRSSSPAALDPWDEEIARSARSLSLARKAYAERLAAIFADVVSLHRYHVADLEFRYASGTIDDVDAPAEAWLERVRRSRSDEIRLRRTSIGPHRDNVLFTVGGRPAAEVLSGGELKTVTLFLKFAKIAAFRAETGEAPLFLLDDIDAELDLDILESLLSRLPPETQLFATSAKESYLSSLRAAPHRRFRIAAGRLSEALDG
jgi:DNA replication and repair protein RecF